MTCNRAHCFHVTYSLLASAFVVWLFCFLWLKRIPNTSHTEWIASHLNEIEDSHSWLVNSLLFSINNAHGRITGVCMCSQSICGFSPGTPASPSCPKTCILGQLPKLPKIMSLKLTLGVSVDVCLTQLSLCVMDWWPPLTPGSGSGFPSSMLWKYSLVVL